MFRVKYVDLPLKTRFCVRERQPVDKGPLDEENSESITVGVEVWYTKENTLGISRMLCNVKTDDGTWARMEMDAEVLVPNLPEGVKKLE